MVVRPAVIAGSTAAHLVVLWCIAEDTPPSKRSAAPPPRPIAVRDAIPIEIAFVAGSDGTQRTTRPSPGRAGTRRARSGGSETDAGTGVTPRSEDTSAPPSSASAGSSWMRMRGTDLRLDPATVERIASADGAAAPRDEVHASGRLERQPGGRAVVHDTVTTMTVDADGDATFHDKPDVVTTVQVPFGAVLDPEFRREVRDHIARWLEDPSEGMRYGRATDLPAHLQAVPQACDVWGSDFCVGADAPDFEKRLRSIKQKLRGGVGGTLDLTAMLQRKVSGDPYASRKLKLLDETRDERVAIGERFRAQQAARSAELMRRNLERLWANEPDPRARREALYQLWEECADDEAGRRARSIVLGWIRARLPRGSVDAFTDAEIAALGFDPYEPAVE